MRIRQLPDRSDTICSHGKMDRACSKRVPQTARTKSHFRHRHILNQHRDHDITTLADVCHRPCHPRAGRREVCRGLGHDIVNGKIVPTTQDAVRHSFSHPAQADETHVHCEVALLSRKL